MNAISIQLLNSLPFLGESARTPCEPKRGVAASRKSVDASGVASKNAASRAVVLPLPHAGISRRIDWYVKDRCLPTLVADFLDTHWRLYTLRCCQIDGKDSESCREAVATMKELAWSVRPKRNFLSRRRMVAQIPELYQRLHVGLESVGFGKGETQHDDFFDALAKLHQTALNLQAPETP